MKKFKRYKVGSSLNVRIDVLDIIKEDHLARQIEGYVSQLNTSQIESKYSNIGQKAFHPKMMLSVILYGYTQGVRSGRKLATSCNENLAFIYLSKNQHPQKSAINDFRKDNYKHFESFFLQILQMMDQTEVGNFDLSMADGSKVGANSSKKRTKNKEQFKKWKDKLREDIGEIEQELLISKSSGEKERKKKELERKTELKKKIKKMVDDLEEEESDKSRNLSDPDSPIMKGKKGNFDTFYNVQVGCNEKGMIGFCRVVTKGNDKAQLIPTLEGLEKNIGKKVKTILADADYGNYESLEYMSKNGIEGYVPFQHMNTEFKDKPFHTKQFTYQAQTDTFLCPEQKHLIFLKEYKPPNQDNTFRQYRTDACKECPFQKECCPKGLVRRIIQRELRQGHKDSMKERLNSKEGKAMYNRRMHPVESIFGHLKHNLGYDGFLLRGIEKVNAEFTIMCIAYNLMKMVNNIQILTNKGLSRTYKHLNGIFRAIQTISIGLEIISFFTKKSNFNKNEFVNHLFTGV